MPTTDKTHLGRLFIGREDVRDGHLILGQCSSFVRTYYIHTTYITSATPHRSHQFICSDRLTTTVL